MRQTLLLIILTLITGCPDSNSLSQGHEDTNLNEYKKLISKLKQVIDEPGVSKD